MILAAQAASLSDAQLVDVYSAAQDISEREGCIVRSYLFQEMGTRWGFDRADEVADEIDAVRSN